MAKRKRLDPARLDAARPPEAAADAPRAAVAGTPAPEAAAGPLETKSVGTRYPLGVYQPPRRAPIADVAGEASAVAALEEVTRSLNEARSQGRMIQALALDVIDPGYLVRDRVVVDEAEMQALCDSLAARGQQTAIEVADLGGGRWGLISGWRRLTALRRLRDRSETPEDRARFDTVLAIARQPGDAAEAYLAMVEENEIRVGLSYYERARIVARATDKGVYRNDRAALSALFHAASRAKRSKVGSFVRIVRSLDDALHHPGALTERSGLALSAALDADPGLAGALSQRLTQSTAPATPEEEARIIAEVVKARAPAPEAPARRAEPAPKPGPEAPAPAALAITGQGADSLALAGPALRDPAFRSRLMAWLSAHAVLDDI